MQEFIITGTEVAALAEVDTITKQLMRKKDIPGGAVAIVKDDRLVFARGYTYKERAVPYIQPTSLFRLASCSKPITGLAIKLLLGDDLDRKVAPILNLTPPPGKTIQPAYNTVTVRHLLNHTSRLSDGGLGDVAAANAFGISLPVNKYQAAAEIITEPFRGRPGGQWEYSNYGYALLCLVVEKLAGSSYERFVRKAIFSGLGIKRPFVGRSLLSERAPGEVVYHDAAGRMDRSSVHADGRQVNICYGHMNMQNQAGFGGWVFSAPDYAQLIAVYNPVFNFDHGGYFAGTLTWVKHLQSDKVGIVALFNKDGNGIGWDDAKPDREYSATLQEIADKLTKSTKWPTHNLFASVDIPSKPRSWVDSDLSAILSAPSGNPWGSQPMGYIRADSVTSVIFRESNGHIREFALKNGQWQHSDLTQAANAPKGKGAQGIVRADGVTTVVYMDGVQHIRELSLQTGIWQHADLTAGVNAPAIFSDFHHSYVRTDGVTSTVYTGADKHIHEVALENGKWAHYDLTNAANATPPLYAPWGYMRSDDVTAVIYHGTDQHIHELALQNGEWVHSDLTAVAKATPIKATQIMGYVRADGRTSVLYLATDDHIHELVLVDGQWLQFDLTQVANAAPILFETQGRPWGYVRADRVSAVVYRGQDNHIYELSLPGEQWQSLDLTKATKAPSCASTPMGYVRADGVTAIVYQASDGHIHEMALH